MDKQGRGDTGAGKFSEATVEAAKRNILFGAPQPAPQKKHKDTPGRRARQDTSLEEKSVNKSVLDVADRNIELRIDGETKQVSMQDALTNKIFDSALKGSTHAQRLAMALVSDARAAERHEKEVNLSVWQAIRERKYQELAEAEEAGLDVSKILPHPDDIVLDPEQGVRFIGPLTEAALEDALVFCAIRDAFILQHSLDNLRLPRAERISATPGDAYHLAALANEVVPKRFKLSDDEMIRAWKAAMNLTKRALLKATHSAWKRAGVAVPRGATSGSPQILNAIMPTLLDLTRRPGSVPENDQVFEDAADAIAAAFLAT